MKLIRELRKRTKIELVIIFLSALISGVAIWYSYQNRFITAYGDAESHLNISKRVVDSLTPGLAQLGGIWLPLPHILMIPFILNDFLWRTGLAGSIVSGIAYVISCVYLYRLVYLATGHKLAGFVGFLAFALNPNILYMQTTPMTEIPLIVFFILSTYYFFVFLKDRSNIFSLILSATFAFCASLSRYDGWGLILVESGILMLYYLFERKVRRQNEGKFLLFSTLAFFGILLWLFWDFIILGDPLYFTNSAFSAKSQQQGWLSRGELPAFRNLPLSFLYYAETAIQNIGWPFFMVALIGLTTYIFIEKKTTRFFEALVLFVPFIFYVVTMYLGQSVIFIPSLTPKTFEWNLFNVRYGIMMVPVAAFFIGYLYNKSFRLWKALLVVVIFLQLFLYFGPRSSVPITLADGITGLSASKHPDAETWFRNNYDHGLVLLDDYARTLSILKSSVPMDKVIYIGTKPYWEISLNNPEKYARWVVLQKDDTVWKNLLDDQAGQAQLYKYFAKTYTSPGILIFKRNNVK